MYDTFHVITYMIKYNGHIRKFNENDLGKAVELLDKINNNSLFQAEICTEFSSEKIYKYHQ